MLSSCRLSPLGSGSWEGRRGLLRPLDDDEEEEEEELRLTAWPADPVTTPGTAPLPLSWRSMVEERWREEREARLLDRTEEEAELVWVG